MISSVDKEFSVGMMVTAACRLPLLDKGMWHQADCSPRAGYAPDLCNHVPCDITSHVMEGMVQGNIGKDWRQISCNPGPMFRHLAGAWQRLWTETGRHDSNTLCFPALSFSTQQATSTTTIHQPGKLRGREGTPTQVLKLLCLHVLRVLSPKQVLSTD